MNQNEFMIPNIGVFPQSVTNAGTGTGLAPGQTPKRNLQINNIKFNNL